MREFSQGTARFATGAFLAMMLIVPTGAAIVRDAGADLDAPGSLIWVGGHRLHLHCVGNGSPTVIFESGLGGSSLDWVRVQPEVARFTRACAYDRAGYGWSDAGPMPRDSAHISRELQTLLGNASVSAPYVLVGHSFGGFSVRLFSHVNPHQVAGLVLLDASHEDQFRRFDEAGVGSSAPRNGSFIVFNTHAVPNDLPEEIAPLVRSLAARRKSRLALLSELGHLRNSANQLRNISMPDVPVVVISRRIGGVAATHPEATRARIWMDMQSDLARRAIQGKHVISATEDHYIQLSQPRLIIESIRDLIETSRQL